jgi:hypothetical protein
MVDFHEIQQGGHVTDIDAIYFKSRIFNHSKAANVQTPEVDAKLAPVKVGP